MTDQMPRINRFETADLAAGGTPRPFAKAVRAGDFIYVSGQVPAKDGEIISGGIVAQTEQVMSNLTEVLKIVGCGLEHVVKVNCWLDDPRDFSSFNGVFAKYFTENPPARSTVKAALMGSAPGRGVIPTLARAEWSLARSSGEVRAGCWAAMDVLR